MLNNDDYQIYKAILWFIVDNEKMPSIQDLSVKLNMPPNQIRPRLQILETEGLIKSQANGIKIIKDLIWCNRRDRPCYS
ncbi:hypothetical protein SAMN05660649_05025 [Desulfotomaculum arcticum]|uniref:LexA DNA binding domain-containing protein n=1 Tax=Desulfotruncus arcticus DSM 17038 TaxID=1121424 RepID=A0A1I2ZMZ2_9FIRM|nr:hypothetical protein SAMN05660649_05025 [Desulfotomaculum arcticum] [Desulfotruncus arcticus DSM 17038]